MSETMTNKLIELCGKDIRTASNAELYHALLKLVDEKKPGTGSERNRKKALLYFSRIPDWKNCCQ